MVGVVRLVAGTSGTDPGTNAGATVIVLALYGSIFVFALVAWIAWGIRQGQGGVVHWGEGAPPETLGQKIAGAWKTASAAPTPPVPAPPPLPFFDYEAEENDERRRTAG